MVELAPVAAFVHADDRIVFANPAGARLLGTASARDLIGRHRLDFIHPEDRAASAGRVSRMLAGVPQPRVEQRFLRADGAEVIGEVDAVGIDHGGRRAVLLFVRDITAQRGTMEQLRRARAAMDLAPDPIFLIDPVTLRYVDVNSAACRLLGHPREALLTMRVPDLTEDAGEAAFRALYATVIEAGPGQVTDEHEVRRLRRADGSVLPVEVRRSAIHSGGRDLIIAVARDLGDRLRAEEQRRLRDLALEASDNAIILVDMRDPAQPIEYVNSAFERMTGFAAAESIGRNCRFLRGDDHAQPELARLRQAIAEGREARVLLRNYRSDGRLFWKRLAVSPVRGDDGSITHYVGVATDVTDLTAERHELEHRASHDPLTGLANRRLLAEQLGRALAQAERHGRGLAVVFVDLDGFKRINDSLGHSVGDELLQLAAQRLTACVRDGDTVSRTGGDEFVLVLSDQSTEEHLRTVLGRIADTLGQPYRVNGGEALTLTCSIGASLYPRHGADGPELIRRADQAMYLVKSAGRNGWRIAD